MPVGSSVTAGTRRSSSRPPPMACTSSSQLPSYRSVGPCIRSLGSPSGVAGDAPRLSLVRPVVRVEPVGFAPPAHRPFCVAVGVAVPTELETARLLRPRRVLAAPIAPRPLGRQRVAALAALLDPVEQRGPVLALSSRMCVTSTSMSWSRSGNPSGTSMSRRGLASTLAGSGRTDDHPVLVDPHRHRDVRDAEQLVADVLLVDERRMSGSAASIHVRVARRRRRRARPSRPRSRFVLLRPQRLPPGQARTASSPGRPGDEQHLLPRSDDNLKTLPSRSGSSSSGASALASA